ncbi:DUF3817 domain-containing protein [bacterium]|nr:MAG: DUF3817 domain-containing protein [bacterium]
MIPLKSLRTIGLCEGVSFLVLLLIAMPLKYLANQPSAVKIVGTVHGGLFLLYLSAGLVYGFTTRWPLGRFAALVFASALPLGAFVFDGTLKREEAAA